MSSSPLKLDLTSAQCLSLELHFGVELSESVRRELALLGSREEDQEDVVYFHEDYRQSSPGGEGPKLHSWAEARLLEPGPSEVVIEYLVESELEDQTELHHTDFTLSHLFDALESVTELVTASFTLRFDLSNAPGGRLQRLLPYDVGFNGGRSIEYRGAHLQVKDHSGDLYDLWFDLRPDEGVEVTLRFSLTERPTLKLPGQGLAYGQEALTTLLAT